MFFQYLRLHLKLKKIFCLSGQLLCVPFKFKAQEVLQTRQSYTAYSIKFDIDNRQTCNMSTKRLWE